MVDPTDPRLGPGGVLVVDDDPLVARRLAKAIEGLWRGPVLAAHGVDEAVELLTLRPGRPRLAGAVLDWYLDRWRPRATAGEVMEWLDFAYPRTPIQIVTGGTEPIEARRFCEHRDLAFAQKPIDQAWLRTTVGGPFRDWDRRARHARRALLGWAGLRSAELREPLLRIVDAYLESVPRSQLAEVRGIARKTAQRGVRDVEQILGASLDEVRTRWERRLRGRGLS